MINVIYGGATVFRFVPHRAGAAEIETQAQTTMPPIPHGSELLDTESGQFVGRVDAVLPSKMQRWVVKFTAAGLALEAEKIDFPLAALREHLSWRVWVIVRSLGLEQVSEISAMTAADLEALPGVGPKSIEEIRGACLLVTGADGNV